MAGGLPEWLELRTFGGWAYAETDGNFYAIGAEGGELDNALIGINLQATPFEKLTFVVQLDAETRPISGDVELELDYAFAEWAFSDAFKLRAGRVKHPFGIYGEIFDIGILRPFTLLPQSVYGPLGITAEWYAGAGLTGVHFFGPWGVEYDVYGGEIQGEVEPLAQRPGRNRDLGDTRGFEVKDLLGGRIQILTPIRGLIFGASGYSGDQVGEFRAEPQDTSVLGIHVQYRNAKWLLRGEAVLFEQARNVDVDARYLEVARRLGQRWWIAARFDRADATRATGFRNPSRAKHQDLALGLSFFPRPEVVIRIDLHNVEGNRVARQVDLNIPLVDDTDMVVFGVQFSF